jgi:hypothetical protein
MLISVPALARNVYWIKLFSKEAIAAICYWYDKWLHFVMHPMEMMAWSEIR